MPFNTVFERRVNEDMQGTTAGSSNQPPSPSPSFTDTDIKKSPRSPKAESVHEALDLDLSSKGDKSLPPRFSTLFDTNKPPPTPRVVECCHREEKKRKGVHLSTPVFALLVGVLLFESTLLFAYTVIGLYQNLPAGFAGIVGAPAPIDGCKCDAGHGMINFAPEFNFAGADGKLTGIGGVTSTATIGATTTETEKSTTTSAPGEAAAAASQILSMLGDDKSTTSPSPSVAVVTTTPGVVRSTVVVTSSLGASETDTSATSTITSVQIVDGPATTIQARSLPSER